MKKGFTIVELMMVIGIIGILTGVVFTAASNSVKAGRKSRAEAMCAAVQSGLATYYAQKEQWPGPLGEKIKNGSIRPRTNDEGANRNSDDDKYVLEGNEVRECVKELVLEAKDGNPMMDISGLWVSRSSGETGATMGGKGANVTSGKAIGMSFMDAIRGTKQSKKKMKVSEMHYGYPDPESGDFRRFKMVYSIPTDQLSVMMQ